MGSDILSGNLKEGNAQKLKAAKGMLRHKPEEALKVSQKILEAARADNNRLQEAEAHHNIGAANLWLANYDEALHSCIDAQGIFEDHQLSSKVAEVLYTSGMIFFYLSDYKRALKSFEEALKLYKKDDNLIGVADAHNGIGSAFYTLGENEKALEHLISSNETCQKEKAYNIQQKVLDGLGKTYNNLGQYDEALQALNDCLKIIEENDGSDHVKAHCYNNLGNVYKSIQDFDQSQKYYEKSLELNKSIKFEAGRASCLANIGSVHLKKGELKKAVSVLNETIEISKQVKAKDVLAGAYKILSETYEKLEQPERALENFKNFHESSEEIKKHNFNLRSKSADLKYKVEQERSEKKYLEAQNEELKKHSDDLLALANIGKSLFASLSVEKIIQKAYEQVNTIMEATSFGLGIYDEQTKKINFPGYIEKGEIYQNITYDTKEKNRLVNVCFLENREVVINDFEIEYAQWLKNLTKPKAGENTESIIYLPFQQPNGSSGVITAQSFKKNAYSDYHVNMLRSLAVYMLIALDNATIYQKLEEKVEKRTEEIEKQKENLKHSYQLTRTLNEIGRELTLSSDFDSIFSKLHGHLNKLMKADCFGVRLYKPEEEKIIYRYEIENGVVDEVTTISAHDSNNYSVICIKNNQAILINDNLKEYHKYTDEIVVPTGEMPHSLIFYPMTIGESVIGLITVQSFQKNAYTQQHVDILKTLSSFTAIALENVNLVENLEEKVADRTQELTKQKEEVEKTYQNTQLLKEIGREIISSLSVTNVIEKIYDNVNRLMDSSIFGIGIVNNDKKVIEIKGAIEKGKKLPDFDFRLDDKSSLAAHCVIKEEEIFISDFDRDIKKYIEQYKKTEVGERPESIIYIPLMIKEKAIGTIAVQSFQKNAYSEYQLDILRNLALYAATAIENAGLYRDMEEKVEERTSEVVKQKEEIQGTYDNMRLLSQVGQEIISTHDLEEIFEKMHQNVNKLMDGTIFSIRTCDYEKNIIDYKYTIEANERIGDAEVSLDDIDNYSVWCVKNKEDIFINDHQNEYHKYTNNIVVVSGDLPESLIFSPMVVKGEVIGTITAQSFEKHAYSKYHLDILRTLGTYCAIALENANLIHNMEDEVSERTKEVVQQKEKIEKSYENTKLLSEIGKEIASELSTKNIISKVYKNLNNLMDASVFAIGIYREEEQDLFFSGAMEKGQKLDDFAFSVNEQKIAATCFNNQKEIVINDWEKELYNYVEASYEAEAGVLPESMIYLPLISKGKIIGVLTVQSFVKEIYSNYHLNILRSLSIYIASAIENANLYQGMEGRVEERTKEINTAYQNTKLLNTISKDIAESLDIETIIQRIYDNINSLMDATSFGIGIYEEEYNRIRMPGTIENNQKLNDSYYQLNDERLATWCFNNGKEVFISNYFEEYNQYIKNIKKPIAGKDSKSIIYIPLFLKEKTIGLLTVQSYEKNAYSEYHLDILRNLATSIAAAIENALLYKNLEDKVKSRTAEVVQQKEIIEEKNQDITDSIRYAERIQSVILPSMEAFQKAFKNSFIFFKPRDIVSGDFYWLEEVDDKIYVSVVDCTGHGVPGALVSLVGANGLNRCLVEFGLRKPSEILDQLSVIVTKTFAKTDSNVKDGMDMALCCFSKNSNEVEYAGANNPLWLIRDKSQEKMPYKTTDFQEQQLIEIKADKQPIGHYVAKQPFTNHKIQLKENDSIYMFSDGYADQFGGLEEKVRKKGGKKFKYSNFKKLMVDLQDQPMEKQHKAFNQRFEQWKGDFEQIDDVCLLGIKI